ncbi:MAG: (d)CMP kinase [Lachnospirales bacterium]
MSINIAIDGPGGSGKSTIAKALAMELGFVYVDTGAMYRAVALYCMENNIDLNNEELVTESLKNINIEIQYIDNSQNIFLNNVNISSRIRNQDCGNGASKVAVYRKVREELVSMQKNMAANTDVIMDGRDIGSNVLKNAQYKFYLDASVDVRAKRRNHELKEKGETIDLNLLKKEIEERDHRDKTREISPLVQVEDAIYIDTSSMSINEVKEKIKMVIK